MKIAFVSVVHFPDDERIWFQQAESLKKAGCEVFVISTRIDNCLLPNTFCFDDLGIPKLKVVSKIVDCLQKIKPQVIICDNPIAVLAGVTYKKSDKNVQVVYDITEWYPSKKNLRNISFLKKVYKIFATIPLSLYAGLRVDKFIFGEYYKAKPFRILFFWKDYIFLPYYATFSLVKSYPISDISKKCEFFYAGRLNSESGFCKLLEVVVKIAQKYPKTAFSLQILTAIEDMQIKDELPSNLQIKKKSILPFKDFCQEIGKSDIFFDLRKKDVENTHCLPIKLFYYMASGRPVIYSDLKAIRKKNFEINQIGFLVNPTDTNEIINVISNYLQNPDLYRQHSLRARQLAEEKYNWESLENKFVNFVCGK